MMGNAWLVTMALLILVATSSLVGCGREEDHPAAQDGILDTPRAGGRVSDGSLPQLLDTDYRGRSIREYLEADLQPGYVSDVLIAFDRTFGERRHQLLARTIQAAIPADSVKRLLLLDGDEKAASSCKPLLRKLAASPNRPFLRLTAVRLLIELHSASDEHVHLLVASLSGDDRSVSDRAASEILRLGTSVDFCADQLFAYVQHCDRDHSSRSFHSTRDVVIELNSNTDHCEEVLHALSKGGAVVNRLVLPAARLLRSPRAERVGLLRFLASRGVASAPAVRAICAVRDDADSEVREFVAYSLASIGGRSTLVLEALHDLAKDGAEVVKAAARAAIRNLDSPD